MWKPEEWNSLSRPLEKAAADWMLNEMVAQLRAWADEIGTPADCADDFRCGLEWAADKFEEGE